MLDSVRAIFWIVVGNSGMRKLLAYVPNIKSRYLPVNENATV